MLIGLVAITASAAGRPEPAMLELQVNGGLCEWRIAIYSSGHATVWSEHGCAGASHDGSKYWPVSPEQLQGIRSVIEGANLRDLPDTIEPETIQTDETYMTIRWRMKKETKTIRAYGLDRAKDRGAASRFMRVWKAGAALVPGLQ